VDSLPHLLLSQLSGQVRCDDIQTSQW